MAKKKTTISASKTATSNATYPSLVQGQIDDLSVSLANVATDYNSLVAKLDKRYLLKVLEDTAYEPITFKRMTAFSEGFKTENSRQGKVTGIGGIMYQNEDGTTSMELDFLSIRKSMFVNELVIQQITHSSGVDSTSAGSIVVQKVEEIDHTSVNFPVEIAGWIKNTKVFRCYFDTKQGQVYNTLQVGDVGMCQRPNFVGSETSPLKYYRRRIVGVGADYVDFEYLGVKMVGVEVSAIEVGDNIVQWGNIENHLRQSVVEINTIEGGRQSFFQRMGDCRSILGEEFRYTPYVELTTEQKKELWESNLWYNDTGKNILDQGYVWDERHYTTSSGDIINEEGFFNMIRIYGDFFAGNRDKSIGLFFDSKRGVCELRGQLIIRDPQTGLDAYSEDVSLKQVVVEQKKTVSNESSQSTSSFNRVYNDTNIGKIEKGNLSTSYQQLTAKEGTLAKATEALLSAISPISEEIKSAYELAYTQYSTAYADFNTKLASGEKSISNAIGTNANEAKEATEALKGVDVLVDLTHLAEDKYYPVVLKINSSRRTTISVRQSLYGNSGDPSWATHSSKDFSLYIKWESNGSGWDSVFVVRNVFESSYRFTLDNVPPAGSIGQLTNTSEEYIYCRGGAKYYFNAHDGVAALTNFIVGEEGYTSTANQTAPIKSLGEIVEPFVIYKEAEKLVGELEIGGANLFSTSDIELGKIDINTGALGSASNRFRNKSYIPLTRTSLSISQSNIDIIYIYYDSDKAFIGSSFSPHSWIDDKVVTVPDGVAYIKLYGRKSDDSAISEADLATFKAMIEEATKSSTWRLSDADIAAQTTEEIKSVEQQSYDNIASNLGYTSYEEMEADKAKGETIIKGGSINTDLIDTETLIVKNVYIPSPSGDEPIVEMNAKIQKFGNVKIEGVDSVIKKEGSEEVAVRMSSGMLSDVSGVGANWNSGTAKQGVYSAPTLADVKVLTIGVVPNNGTKLSISGNLLAQSNENSFPATQDTEASISMELRKNGVYYTGIGYAHAYKFAPSTSGTATDTIDFTDIVDAGTYEVYVRVRGDISTGGSLEITMSGRYSNLVASWVYDPNVDRVELAADGLGVMANSENHVIHKFREKNGSQVLDITEKTTGSIDRAGVLCCGVVASSGQLDATRSWNTEKWGIRAERVSSGFYKIYHKIRHKNFVLVPTPYYVTAGRLNALVVWNSETAATDLKDGEIHISINHSSTGGVENAPFAFVINGNNQ